ncbi:MAG: hypothetical protein E6Q06_02040 [Candidatus Moraniibacteriota bacterium]|nr:MAG: hypothetical protein E6Q06_02040 [Candidatus Moranbacteria bacterium]
MQITCTRRNLETVINTSLQEGVRSTSYDGSNNTLTVVCKSVFELNKNLLPFLRTYMIDICLAIFFFRGTSNELVRLTNEKNRVQAIWLEYEQAEQIEQADGADGTSQVGAKMSKRRVIFEHNSLEVMGQLQNLCDKKISIALVVSNVSADQERQITGAAVNNALKISPGKTSDIDSYTQRNWWQPSHVVETAFYCFVDTMLTAMLENNIKMYMNMYNANYLELLPGVLVYRPSGALVLPKTLKSLIEECMVFCMKTPLQCFILFNRALAVQGVPRSFLQDKKRLPLYRDLRAYSSIAKEEPLVYDESLVEKVDNHPLCTSEKTITSFFANEQKTVVGMRAHTTARSLMEWSDNIWNVDEFSLGIMGENSQTLENAERAMANISEKGASSPIKKRTLPLHADRKFLKVSKLNFDQ